MDRYKKWLLSCITGIVIVFVGIGMLVVIVDPFFQYHKPLKNFPYQVDNQINQNPGMAKHMDYDSVILGSSMTVNFNTNWFYEEMGLHTLKLSYSGAYPKDQSNIMELIFARKEPVKKVFLGIDVITYSGDVEETKYPIPTYLYDSNLLNDVQYLYNKDVILNYILRPMADPDKTDLATMYASWWTDEYYNIQWVMHNYEAPEPVEKEVPVDYYKEGIRKNMETNICPYIAQNPDTEFVIFYPPYSILFWNDVVTTNQLKATLEEYRYISEILLAYDNVSLFFFPDQEWIVTDLNHYADYTHYHPDFNHYMTECFADGTCEVTSMQEVEKCLANIEEMIEKFDFEALFSREW